MQIDIKCRWDGRVLFTAELSADFKNASVSVRLGAAVKLALDQGANLYGANLRSADLSGANLRSADLSGADLSSASLRSANLRSANLSRADLPSANLSRADLSSASLRSANLSGANLSSADLYGANLYGADLYGANLYGADLSGANLREGVHLIGERPMLAIGPIGSRRDTLLAFCTNIGVLVRTGCFVDKPLSEFKDAVNAEHGVNAHGREYGAAVAFIEAHAGLWTPPVTEAAVAE